MEDMLRSKLQEERVGMNLGAFWDDTDYTSVVGEFVKSAVRRKLEDLGQQWKGKSCESKEFVDQMTVSCINQEMDYSSYVQYHMETMEVPTTSTDSVDVNDVAEWAIDYVDGWRPDHGDHWAYGPNPSSVQEKDTIEIDHWCGCITEWAWLNTLAVVPGA